MLTDHHREARRTAIVRLLRTSPVRRQQELVRLLKREGHAVTQSSISRDLRELGVLKASDGYVLPDKAELSSRTQDKFSAVAMKIVSSPDTVPATSLHPALSIAAATLPAEPMVVLTTVIDGPAVRTSRTKDATAENLSWVRDDNSAVSGST